MVEWEICPPCVEAVDVMIQTSEAIGEPATSEVLSVLCPPCASAGLDAIGNGPGA